MEIITNTLSEAHEMAFDAIVKQHKEINIQTHTDKEEFTLEFEAPNGGDDQLVLHILHPLMESQVSDGCPFQKGFTEAYKKQFLTLTPPRADGRHPVYTYWNRYEDHPTMIPADICTGPNEESHTEYIKAGDGQGNGIHQVTETIEKLAADPNSRRGVMVGWNPLLDLHNHEPPCMCLMQIVIRNGRVHMRVLFRSQDIGLGLPENLVGCTAFLEHVTNGINQISKVQYEVGELTLVSWIPHIYKKRDQNYFDQMRAEIHRKKTLGLWHSIIR
jgi:thymidylate synthase